MISASGHAYMHSNALVIQIYFYRFVIIPHFYFFSYIFPGHTVIEAIFPKMYMVIALHGHDGALLKQAGVGGKWTKQVSLLFFKKITSAKRRSFVFALVKQIDLDTEVMIDLLK